MTTTSNSSSRIQIPIEPINEPFLYFPDDHAVLDDCLAMLSSSRMDKKRAESLKILFFLQSRSGQVVHFDEMVQYLKIGSVAQVRNALYKVMNSLVSSLFLVKGRISEVTFSNGEEGTNKQIVWYRFVTKNELANSQSELIDRHIATTNQQKALSKYPSFHQSQVDNGFSGRALTHTQKSLSDVSIVRHVDTWIVEQLICPLKNQKKFDTHYVVKNTDGSFRKMAATALSLTYVPTPNELTVGYALLALTYNFHMKNAGYYKERGVYPPNITPFHLDNLIQLCSPNLTTKPSSKHREKYRRCLGSLKFTTYEAVTHNPLFDQNQFVTHRFVDQLSPLGVNDDEHVDPDNFGDGHIGFVVSWPSEIFNSLLTDDSLYAFPQASITAPVLFMLLIQLRILLKDELRAYSDDVKEGIIRKPIEYQMQYSVDQIKSRSSFDGSSESFLEGIKKAVVELNSKEAQPYLSIDTYEKGKLLKGNLFGYDCTFDVASDLLHIVPDFAQVRAACKINNSYGPLVTRNPQSDGFKLLASIDKSISKTIRDKLDISMYQYHFTVSTNHKDFNHKVEYVLSNYVDQSVIDDAVDSIARDIHCPEVSAHIFIMEQLRKLSPLVLDDGYWLTRHQLDSIYQLIQNEAMNLSGDLSSGYEYVIKKYDKHELLYVIANRPTVKRVLYNCLKVDLPLPTGMLGELARVIEARLREKYSALLDFSSDE